MVIMNPFIKLKTMDQPEKRRKLAPIIILGAVILAAAGYFILKQPSQKPAEDVTKFFNLLKAEGETSLEMIDRTVADKKLDEETALVYKVYSVFGDERLPKEYASDKPYYEGTQVVLEMMEKWDSLSAKTKALLEPFRKRPDEKGSWVDLKYSNTEAKPTSWLYKNAYAKDAPESAFYTELGDTEDGKAKIWYAGFSETEPNLYGSGTVETNAETSKKIAERIKDILDQDQIIPKFELMLPEILLSDGVRGGDGKLDIYVGPTGTNLGTAFADQMPPPTSSHILINYAIGLNSDTLLKATLAHEIFHAYQYTYKFDPWKDRWWMEATATWAENFIYPAANTEQEWIEGFIEYPIVSLDKREPPKSHDYSAYLFPFFLSEKSGSGFMGESWKGCSSGCLEGINKSIPGGFREQWKEFTLWNYNKEPAKFYTDAGSFPDYSSSKDQKQEGITGEKETPVEIEKLSLLTARLVEVTNMVADKDKVKKLTFTDLENFTGKGDTASIKAVIYYNDGRNEIEDWTKLKKRSFCIDSKEEDFERVELIFGNGDMKKEIPVTKIKVVSKPNCFEIDQDDKRTAVLYWRTGTFGAVVTTNINTTTDTVSQGEPVAEAPKDAQYGYQTKWKMWYAYEQVRDAFSYPCLESTADYPKGWTTREAGYLEFDLSPDKVSKDGTFPIDQLYGYAHPKGKYEEVPTLNVKCIGITAPGGNFDITKYKGVAKGIYTGKITEMTADGAKIEIPNFCWYSNCITAIGEPYQDISEPIILEIKRGYK